MESLTFVSLNVERSRHIHRVLPFLQKEAPDVCCLQEFCESDIQKIEEALNARCIFVPMTVYKSSEERSVVGIGICSRLSIQHTQSLYYAGSPHILPEYEHPDQDTWRRMLLTVDVLKEGQVFRIGTTHFTWSPNGEVDEVQRKDMQLFLEQLAHVGEIVYMGDFNAPRGGEMFSILASHYKDNVPQEYTTSLDGTFHRAGALPFMVDGVFSTATYAVHDVRMVCGVSDHCALVGKVDAMRDILPT